MAELKHTSNNKSKRRRGHQENSNKNKSTTPSKKISQPNHSTTPKSKNNNKSAKNDGAIQSAPQKHTTLLLQLTEEAPKWYLIAKQVPERNETIPTGNSANTTAVVNKYRQQADELFRNEVALALSNQNKDDAWMESTMRKGTLKDRIAAMSVIAAQSPIHHFHVLQQLMDMTKLNQNNSRIAQMAAEALQDLWMHTYLPSNRPLVSMTVRPLQQYEDNANLTVSPRILLLWRFEEIIHQQYVTFIQQYLKHTLHEGVETQKTSALKTAAALLQRIPTAEQLLLELLVNKLGDPVRKVAARAAHELRGVLFHHPAMQPAVAREIQQQVHRPHLAPAALYHCILFLNQLEFSTKSPQSIALATSLIQTYFRLFEVAVTGGRGGLSNTKTKKTDGKLNSRLLSALLTGVNRAHPYVDASHDMEQYLDALYRVVHTAPPAACTQAMLLLFHLVIGVEQRQEEEKKKKRNARNNTAKKDAPHAVTPQTPEHEARRTRFYRALYAKLMDTQLLFSGKHLTQFFNLLYKSLKYDTNERRIQACCKRLVSTLVACPHAATVTAALYLWHEVARIHPFLQQSYAHKGQEAAEYILDGSKRDPRSALVEMDEKGVVTSRADSSDDIRHVNAPVWEMTLLQHHYHPSVVKFTHSLDSELAYDGDPLHDFAFGSFLDKFAYRNPKTSQRIADKNPRSVVMERRRESMPVVPVNDRSFLQKKKDAVGPEDEFFYQFFEERAKRDQVKGIVRHKETKKGHKGGDADDDSQNALDKIEQSNVDDDQQFDDFDEYERAWEDDPDEEAFVDSLAESLMEDTMDLPSDLEDEDPDTEGWDDLHDGDNSAAEKRNDDIDDDDEVVVRAAKIKDDSSTSQEEPDDNDDGDDDAFMDQNDDDSDSEESYGIPPPLDGEDDFTNEDNDDEDDEDGDGDDIQENSDHHDDDDERDDSVDEEDDAELLFLAEETDDEEEEPPQFQPMKKKPKFEASVFASVEDYEERIEESFRELRRVVPLGNNNAEGDDEQMEESVIVEHDPKINKKKRKKNKKNH